MFSFPSWAFVVPMLLLYLRPCQTLCADNEPHLPESGPESWRVVGQGVWEDAGSLSSQALVPGSRGLGGLS